MSEYEVDEIKPVARTCITVIEKQIQEQRLSQQWSANMVATVIMYVHALEDRIDTLEWSEKELAAENRALVDSIQAAMKQ